MAEVIVVDSSSDDGDASPPPPPPVWRGIAGTTVYADVVRDALAMASALAGGATAAASGTATTSRRRKRTIMRPPPLKRSHSMIERDARTDSSVSAFTSPAASPSPPLPQSTHSAEPATAQDRAARHTAAPRPRKEVRPIPWGAVVLTLSSSEEEQQLESADDADPDDSDEDVVLSEPGDKHLTGPTRKRLRRLDGSEDMAMAPNSPPIRYHFPGDSFSQAVESHPALPAREDDVATVAAPSSDSTVVNTSPGQSVLLVEHKENGKMVKESQKTQRVESSSNSERTQENVEISNAKTRRVVTPDPAFKLFKTRHTLATRKRSNGKARRRKRLLQRSSGTSSDRSRGPDDDETFKLVPRVQSSDSEEEWTMPPIRAGQMQSPVACRKSAPSLSSIGRFAGATSRSSFLSAQRGTQAVRKSAPVSSRPSVSVSPTRPRVVNSAVTMFESESTSEEDTSPVPRLSPTKKMDNQEKQRKIALAKNRAAVHETKSEDLHNRTDALNRPRRQLEPHFNTDSIAFKDLQGQEAEFARLKAQKAMLAPFQTKQNRDVVQQIDDVARPEVATTMDLCSSSDESGCGSNASVGMIELRSIRCDQQQGDGVLVLPRSDPVVANAAAAAQDGVSLPAVAHGVQQSHKSRKDLARQWRGAVPSNLLRGNSVRNFEKIFDDPLTHFDDSGELQQKCAFLASFGQSQQFASSSYSLESMDQPQPTDRISVEHKVRSILAECLPRIRHCYAQRSSVIIAESRSAVRMNLVALANRQHLLIATALRRSVSSERKRLLSGAPRVILEPASWAQRGDGKIFQCRGGGGDEAPEKQIGEYAKVLFMPMVEPLSRSVTCVTVSRNYRVDDDPLLRFLPIATDSSEETAHSARPRPVEPTVRHEFTLPSNAVDNEVTELAIRAVVAQCGDQDVVFEALKTVAGLSQPYTDYSTLKKSHDAVQVAQRRLIDAMRVSSDLKRAQATRGGTLLDSIVSFKPESEKSLRERLAPPPTYFDSHIVRWHLEQKAESDASLRGALNVRRTGEYTAMLETYRDFFCRLCYCYDCQEHGIEQPQPSRRVDPIYPRFKNRSGRVGPDSQDLVAATMGDQLDELETIDVDDSSEHSASDQSDSELSDGADGSEPSLGMQRRRSSRSMTVAVSTATTNWELQERKRRQRQQRRAEQVGDSTEYIDFSHVELLTQQMQRLLTADAPCSEGCWKLNRGPASRVRCDPSALVMVKKLAVLLGPNACVVAAMIKEVSCWAVNEVLDDLKKLQLEREGWDEDCDGRARRKPGRIGLLSTVGTTHSSRVPTTARALQLPAVAFGVITAARRHAPVHGIVPTDLKVASAATVHAEQSDARVSLLVPFVDLVHSKNSESTTTPVPSHGHHKNHGVLGRKHSLSAIGTRSATCANVHLQRGARQTLAIGKSRIHGWGAFVMAPMRRGDFVTEYPGELISQDEAERRGLVYDRLATSYLFDLNEDAVVDAIRMGNKSRFINHGSSQANCNAKVVRVGAEHRITIWAKRDIKAGEELFFDYGYKTESAPVWSQIRQTAEIDHDEAKKNPGK